MNGLISLVAGPDGCCTACSENWGLEEPFKDFTEVDILSAKGYIRRCSNTSCLKWKDYDGAEDQLLFMGSFLVSHEVLRNYMRQYITEGIWCETLELANSDFQLNEDMEQGDIAEQQSDDEDDSNDISEPFITKISSFLDISIHLHDYCGPINLNVIAASLIKNQSTQTNTLRRIDVSTQCDFNEMSPEHGTPVKKVTTVDCRIRVNSRFNI